MWRPGTGRSQKVKRWKRGRSWTSGSAGHIINSYVKAGNFWTGARELPIFSNVLIQRWLYRNSTFFVELVISLMGNRILPGSSERAITWASPADVVRQAVTEVQMLMFPAWGAPGGSGRSRLSVLEKAADERCQLIDQFSTWNPTWMEFLRKSDHQLHLSDAVIKNSTKLNLRCDWKVEDSGLEIVRSVYMLEWKKHNFVLKSGRWWRVFVGIPAWCTRMFWLCRLHTRITV